LIVPSWNSRAKKKKSIYILEENFSFFLLFMMRASCRKNKPHLIIQKRLPIEFLRMFKKRKKNFNFDIFSFLSAHLIMIN
jgi:hypothetical protein